MFGAIVGAEGIEAKTLKITKAPKGTAQRSGFEGTDRAAAISKIR